jgi:hypothetical protein
LPALDPGLIQSWIVSLGEVQTMEIPADFPEMVLEMVERVNIVSALSSIPIGLPSLMAGLRPLEVPWGLPAVVRSGTSASVVGGWLGLGLIGILMGALYHRVIAIQVNPESGRISFMSTAVRIMVMTILFVIVLFIFSSILLILTSLVTFILPQLASVMLLLGFSMLFWVGVYLMFTPHGIVRYGFNIPRAVMESARLVRRSFIPTILFVATSLFIIWLTNIVWAMPTENSWFTMLAILGHSFISVMILASEYAYFQGRFEWFRSDDPQKEAPVI